MTSPGNTGMKYSWSEETRIKARWVRINNCAHNDNVTVEEMAKWSDRRILLIPNMGVKCLALLREKYGPATVTWEQEADDWIEHLDRK